MYLSEEALYVFSPRSPHQPPKTDEAKRDTFISQIEAYKNQGRPIVYADESGFAKDMPRAHGYCARGKRCYGTHNWQERGRIDAIGAILEGTFLTCFTKGKTFKRPLLKPAIS